MANISTMGSIPQLNGLRTLSIFIVFCYHFFYVQELFFPGTVAELPIIHLLGMRPLGGVSLAFILSGFSVTRSIEAAWRKNPDSAISIFLFNRFLKIAPALAFFLLFFYFSPDPVAGGISLQELIQVLFSVQNYLMDARGPLSWTWSLAVEIHFYLIFCFLFLIYKSISLSALRFFGVCLGVTAVVALAVSIFAGIPAQFLPNEVGADAFHHHVYAVTHYRIAEIFLGVVLYFYWKGSTKVISGRITLGLLIVATLYNFMAHHFQLHWLPFSWGSCLFFACLVLYVLQQKVSLPSRLAAWPGWKKMSEMSFCAFLIHPSILFHCYKRLPDFSNFSIFILSLLLTLMIAKVFYLFVEKPFQKFKVYSSMATIR